MISESRYSYRRPARLDDELLIDVTAQTATQSGLTAHFAVRRGDDLLTAADISYVAVRDRRRCPLPDELQRLIPHTAPDAETLLTDLHRAQAALYESGDTSAIESLLDPEVVWRSECTLIPLDPAAFDAAWQ